VLRQYVNTVFKGNKGRQIRMEWLARQLEDRMALLERSDQLYQVLDRGDEQVLDGLFNQRTPSGPFEVVFADLGSPSSLRILLSN